MHNVDEVRLAQCRPETGLTRFELPLPALRGLWPDRRRLGRTLIGLLMAGLLGSVAAELFLRLIMPPEIAYQTFYSPGIHTPSPKYGFVFAKNYHGRMVHSDNVAYVPLRHDEFGFRPPAATPTAGPVDTIVLLGGASMVYGYGVPDQYTLPATMVQAASRPIRVYNAAWPGFDVYRMFHAYCEFLEPHIAHPQVAILCLYNVDLADFAQMPDDMQHVPPPPPQAELFRYMDNMVLSAPKGLLSKALGRYYFQSYVGARLASALDRIVEVPLRICRVATAPHPNGIAASSLLPSPSREAADARNLEKLVKFISYVDQYFQRQNTTLMVAILPVAAQLHTAEKYAPIVAALPRQIPCLNLHQELSGQLQPSHFLGAAHYGPYASTEIGRRLAARACQILAENPAADR